MKKINKFPKAVVCSPKSVVHIYTGDGKGKTTAVMGLALRACGAKKNVVVLQFMKKGDSSEIKAIKKYKLPIDIFCFSAGFCGILGDKKPKSEHQKEAEKGLKKAELILKSGKYDLVILDEINVAIDLGLLDVDNVIDILRSTVDSPRSTDIILTGRNAHPKLKKMADLISNIKKEKHYFDKNIPAKKGIEF